MHENTKVVTAQLSTIYTVNSEKEKEKRKELRAWVEIIQIPNQKGFVLVLN